MAAFIDGILPPAEVAGVAAHLRECADCRIVVAETARFEREEEAPAASRSGRFSWWLAVAAALAAIAVAVPLLLRYEERRTSPIAELIAVAPRDHRRIEARLSGFPWARLAAPSRGAAPPDPGDLKLGGAAGDVLEASRDERTPEARHAVGVAYLLIGRDAESIDALEKAAHGSSDKRIWNDLAAARLSASEEHPSQHPLALAAADRALKIDGNFAAAAFNRALILERMGAREKARAAWQRYLQLDPAGEWSNEARAHLRRLDVVSDRFDEKMLRSSDPAQVVARFPQEARTWGEGPLLAEWADAANAENPKLAAEKLTLPRALGEALAARGEHLLEDAVAAIDRADVAERSSLAEAHRLYRAARIDYSRHAAGKAGPQFRRAADLFRRGKSPMALLADYYAAGTDFDQNRGPLAHDELTALLATIDVARTPALAAQIHWTLALTANSMGDWGTAVRESDAAAAIFRAHGETQNAAFVDGIGAYALELIGDRDRAWSHRLEAIAGLCGRDDRERCNSLLQDSATTLAAVDQPVAAMALLDATIERTETTDPALLVSSMVKRARVAREAGDVAAARDSLTSAASVAARIPDRALREIGELQIDVEEASLRRASEPLAAIASLDRAKAFLADRQLRYLLPRVELEEARAYRSAGHDDSARAAYQSVLDEIRVQQATIGDANLRLTFRDTARQAIEESIDLALANDRVEEAFRIADHRQALTERTAAARLRIPAGVAVIEYAVLPKKLVSFFVSSRGIEVTTTNLDRVELASQVESLDAKIRRRAPLPEVQRQAATLYMQLIAPLRKRLQGIEELVIVPDRQLHAVPFGALYDEAAGRYLTEQFTIRMAAAAGEDPSAGALEPALVVADPPTSQGPRLTASRDEAERVAAMHRATLIAGTDATREHFLEGAARVALIHFAGHADTDAGQSWGALLLAESERDSGILGTAEIAQLALARAPLVVLAACGTFRGDLLHVSGMSSLARAFLMAGARGVVGTLWEIDDDVAASLFLDFHQRLHDGESPARALQLAQMAMLASGDPRLRHPAAWAPVELLTR